MRRIFRRLAVPLTAAVAVGCGDSAPKVKMIDHVVTGKVTVKDGKPGAGIKLMLVAPEGQNKGAVYNVVTDEEGKYTVNSLLGNGGPAEGDYVVCVSLPLGPGKDQFNGEFNDPKTTPYKVSIRPDTTELEPIAVDKYDLSAWARKKPKPVDSD